MKRNQNRRETGGCSKSGESSSPAAGKEKSVWGLEEEGLTGGMDELLAVLGYKVRSSDMADVALKLEQLEVVLGSVHTDGISHLSNDAVHYNPSDLSTWVESMLSDIDPTRIHYHDSSQSPIYGDVSNYDLGAIPGSAAYPRVDSEEEKERKRVKTEPGSDLPSCLSNSVESTRPMVLIDSQETGVRLVHSLLACAEAVQQNDMELADALVKHVGILAASTTTQIGAMRKVATYFAEGLARRIYRIYPRDITTTKFDVTLHANFYESCPYLKFAHFTANQAILEAFTTHHSRVHVIDFGINQGLQWPALIQALALHPSGSPVFRLTGIGPQPSEIVGRRLAQLAETLGVKFEYKSLVLDNLSDLQPDMLEARPESESESIAVNSVFELHRVLAQPGSIDRVLFTVKAVKPKVFTLVEQEANHNSPVFLDRFTESLHYYSSLFDSLEGPPSQDRVLSELYLGKQILNLVAFEGVDRTVRHEKLVQWRNRFGSAGFERVHLGSNAYKQASMLLELHNGADGYKVEENDGCLFLGWHTRPLIATSAWKLAEKRVN